MGFDRSKYKPAKATSLTKQDSQVDLFPKSKTSVVSYHKYDDGDNKFRIYPEHQNDTDEIQIMYPFVHSYLSVMKPVYKDGQKLDEKVLGKKQLFNARVHGGFPFDIVEAYFKVAKETAIPNFAGSDKAKEDEIYKIINWYRTQTVWVAYADKITASKGSEFGKLTIKSTIRDSMKEIISEFGDGDEPFSCPETGVCLIVNKSGVKTSTKYTSKLEMVKKGLSFELVPTVLSDESLQSFENVKPLRELYVDSYSKSDFDYQIEGLENLDKELKSQGYDINVFQYEEFLSKCEEMSDLVDAKYSNNETEKKESKDDATNPPATDDLDLDDIESKLNSLRD